MRSSPNECLTSVVIYLFFDIGIKFVASSRTMANTHIFSNVKKRKKKFLVCSPRTWIINKIFVVCISTNREWVYNIGWPKVLYQSPSYPLVCFRWIRRWFKRFKRNLRYYFPAWPITSWLICPWRIFWWPRFACRLPSARRSRWNGSTAK